ncbi:MAG: hypothetical protein H6708_30305 [Kofleriaceae bacterium]|nr:hypothetical protein [Kofleriaceae bacterium]
MVAASGSMPSPRTRVTTLSVVRARVGLDRGAQRDDAGTRSVAGRRRAVPGAAPGAVTAATPEVGMASRCVDRLGGGGWPGVRSWRSTTLISSRPKSVAMRTTRVGPSPDGAGDAVVPGRRGAGACWSMNWASRSRSWRRSVHRSSENGLIERTSTERRPAATVGNELTPEPSSPRRMRSMRRGRLFSAPNGWRPVRRSNRTTPSENTSDRLSTISPRTCSGDAYDRSPSSSALRSIEISAAAGVRAGSCSAPSRAIRNCRTTPTDRSGSSSAIRSGPRASSQNLSANVGGWSGVGAGVCTGRDRARSGPTASGARSPGAPVWFRRVRSAVVAIGAPGWGGARRPYPQSAPCCT